MIKAYCSDGARVSEAQIKAHYTHALHKKHAGNPHPICGCGCGEKAVDNDHTIAKARCKEIHKAELIWDPENFESSCRKSHREWENMKGGEWILHANVEKRLRYLKEHDPEGFKKRINLCQLALDEKN